MPPSFMLQDIVGVLFAVLLFPLVLVFPGYVFGYLFNFFEFRARTFPARLAISVLLSFAFSPIFFYLLTSLLSITISLIATGLFAIAFAGLLFREKPAFAQGWPSSAIILIVIGWLIFATFSLIDLQWHGNELYFSVASYDHTTRVSIVDAITRTGVPPINPSYYPGRYVHLTFIYFFWYILCSLVDILGGSLVDARTALYGSVLWCGIALMTIIAIYLRMRIGQNKKEIWKKAFIGMSLLAVTGLDILPALAVIPSVEGTVGDIEHWNEQITAWIGSLLWVPHHVAGLIAAFVGVMLALSVHEHATKERYIALGFAGIAFASATGLSIWVTLVFVLFWGIWMMALFLQKKPAPVLLPMLIAGMVALLLSEPFLLGVISGNSGEGTGGVFPVALTIRSFRLADAFTVDLIPFWRLFIRLTFLPVNYFFELGFFLFVGVIWLRTNKGEFRRNPYHLAETALLAASFFMGTFTRSTLIENNDLGWRAWLPGQLILLIWGVDVLEGFSKSLNARFILPPRTRYNLVLLAALGVSTTLLDATLLRFAYYFAFGSSVGHEIYSARQAYTAVHESLPADVIVQYNPVSIANRPSGLYGMRQSAISDRTAYGVPLNEYYAKVAEVEEIFKLTGQQNWDQVDALCKKQFIEAIVIVDSDPLWTSLKLLKLQRMPVYLDDHHAVFSCGNYP